MVDQGARVARRSEPLTFGAPRALTHVRGNVLVRCTRLGLAENDFQSSCASLEPVLGPREARTRGAGQDEIGGREVPLIAARFFPDSSANRGRGRTQFSQGLGGSGLTRASFVWLRTARRCRGRSPSGGRSGARSRPVRAATAPSLQGPGRRPRRARPCRGSRRDRTSAPRRAPRGRR